MIENEVKQSQRPDDGANEKRFPCGRSPDHVGIEPANQNDNRDPNFAMAQTKFLAKGSR